MAVVKALPTIPQRLLGFGAGTTAAVGSAVGTAMGMNAILPYLSLGLGIGAHRATTGVARGVAAMGLKKRMGLLKRMSKKDKEYLQRIKNTVPQGWEDEAKHFLNKSEMEALKKHKIITGVRAGAVGTAGAAGIYAAQGLGEKKEASAMDSTIETIAKAAYYQMEKEAKATFPISRFFTNPHALAANYQLALPIPGIPYALGYGESRMVRAMHARGMMGRINKGGKALSKREKMIADEVKKKTMIPTALGAAALAGGGSYAAIEGAKKKKKGEPAISAMTQEVVEKAAAAPTYPISRFFTHPLGSMLRLGPFGPLQRVIQRRALHGRVRTGKGLYGNEKKLMDMLKRKGMIQGAAIGAGAGAAAGAGTAALID